MDQEVARYEEFIRRLEPPIRAVCHEFKLDWKSAIALLIMHSVQRDGWKGVDLMAIALEQAAATLPERGIKASNRRLQQLEKQKRKRLVPLPSKAGDS